LQKDMISKWICSYSCYRKLL